MSRDNEDRDLREDFSRLRHRDARGVPGFSSILNRPERAAPASITDGSSRRWWLPAVVFAAALAWFLMPTSRAPIHEVQLWKAGQWVMPSDVLLDLSSLPLSGLMGEFESNPIDLGAPLEDVSY